MRFKVQVTAGAEPSIGVEVEGDTYRDVEMLRGQADEVIEAALAAFEGEEEDEQEA